MIFPWTKPEAKSQHFETVADQLVHKNKLRAAYFNYKKAVFYDATRQALYEKLIKVMDDFKDDWSEDDFVENVYWAMQLKELQDPTFKRLHFRSEPEFQEVTQLIHKMLKAQNIADETQAVEAIVAHDSKALYPLIDFLLHFIKSPQSKSSKPHAETES